jgi:hypothetical protein
MIFLSPHFAHFVVAMAKGKRCTFVALMNSTIICHLVRSRQFAKQSMGSLGRSMSTVSANVVVHIELAFDTHLMD